MHHRDLRKGDLVTHPIWGNGEIIDVWYSGRNLTSSRFEKHPWCKVRFSNGKEYEFHIENRDLQPNVEGKPEEDEEERQRRAQAYIRKNKERLASLWPKKKRKRPKRLTQRS